MIKRLWQFFKGNESSALALVGLSMDHDPDSKIFRFIIEPIHKMGTKFHDGFLWFAYRLHPQYQFHLVRTGLPRGYHDQDERLLHACFALLCDFFEEARECGIPVGDEACRLYVWWTVDRNKLIKEQADLFNRLYVDPVPMEKNVRIKLMAKCEDMEDQIDRDDQTNLHRLIDLRPSLWV